MDSYEDYIERIRRYYQEVQQLDIHHTKCSKNMMKKKKNVYTDKGKVLVSEVKATQLKKSILKSINLISGLKKSFKKSDSVLLIPNYNSDNEFPASTDLKFLESVINILRDFGIKKITIGVCSGIHWMPTRLVVGKMKLLKMADKLRVPVICFDEEDWVKIKLKSNIMEDVSFTEEIFKHEKDSPALSDKDPPGVIHFKEGELADNLLSELNARKICFGKWPEMKLDKGDKLSPGHEGFIAFYDKKATLDDFFNRIKGYNKKYPAQNPADA